MNIFEAAHKHVIQVNFRHYRTPEVMLMIQGTSCPEKTVGYGVCVRQDSRSSSIALFDIERKKWDAIRIESIESFDIVS